MSKNQPIIGISVNISLPDDEKRSFSQGVTVYYLQEHYGRFVEAGGGVPLLLTPLEDLELIPSLVARMDGVLLTGGVDVDPSLYNESNTHSLGCNLQRDRFEIALVNAARCQDRILLGICRGIQIMNVAYGGSLIQDIPTAIPDSLKHHRWEDGKESFHTIVLTAESPLSSLFPAGEVRVNSSHHQSLQKPGKDLQVVATAPDGVVEAVISTADRCAVGIQWHPERMIDDPLQVSLAKWFVSHCHNY